jgi:hypothetical protein
LRLLFQNSPSFERASFKNLEPDPVTTTKSLIATSRSPCNVVHLPVRDKIKKGLPDRSDSLVCYLRLFQNSESFEKETLDVYAVFLLFYTI